MNLSTLRKVPPVQPSKVLDRLEGDIPSDVGDGLSDHLELGCQVGVLVQGIHGVPEAFTRGYNPFDRRTRAGVPNKVGDVPSLGDNLIPKLGCVFVAPKVPSSDLLDSRPKLGRLEKPPTLHTVLPSSLDES
jgi:hypothetical protein